MRDRLNQYFILRVNVKAPMIRFRNAVQFLLLVAFSCFLSVFEIFYGSLWGQLSFAARETTWQKNESNSNQAGQKRNDRSPIPRMIDRASNKAALLAAGIQPAPNEYLNISLLHASSTIKTTSPLWESMPSLPSWMTTYFSWHRDQLLTLDATNWQSRRYLIARCLNIDQSCGGASDRLKSIPLLIRFASQQERLLFVHWERPAPLENFLLPPGGGFNWSLPLWLKPKFNFSSGGYVQQHSNAAQRIVPYLKNALHQMMVDVRFQDSGGGANIYDAMLQPGEPSFAEIYRDVWSIAFRPSASVQALISRHMTDLDLRSGEYSAVHIRYRYPKARDKNLKSLTENAVRCANQLYPNAPVYIASDTPDAIKIARQVANMSLGNRVRSRKGSLTTKPHHLDYSKSREPSKFYDLFVDLYLLAESRCVAYSVGGFGRWGRDLSYNQTCSVRHDEVGCLS